MKKANSRVLHSTSQLPDYLPFQTQPNVLRRWSLVLVRANLNGPFMLLGVCVLDTENHCLLSLLYTLGFMTWIPPVVSYYEEIFNCGKAGIWFSILTILRVRFSGVEHTHTATRLISSAWFIFPSWTLYPSNHSSLLPPPPCPWQPPLASLSLWIGWFQVPHISGMTQYLSSCDWLISLSIMFSKFNCGYPSPSLWTSFLRF